VTVHPDRRDQQATPEPREDPCAVPHGEEAPDAHPERELLAVYASEVAAVLLRWGGELGFRTVLLEPDPERVDAVHRAAADAVTHDPAVPVGAHVDVVVTDHHRDDLGRVMAPLVRSRPRWIGIMGSPRHAGPHRGALRQEGVDEELIDTVHRPIGLDIGSKEPAEIALSTLAGLLADRNGRPGT
jgi:xanthine dehydrogenase accessory factor